MLAFRCANIQTMMAEPAVCALYFQFLRQLCRKATFKKKAGSNETDSFLGELKISSVFHVCEQ